MSAAHALELEHLWVQYGSVPAVRDLGLTVGTGEIVGLIGPNGAGKSTTLKVVSGRLAPTAGCVHIAGTHVSGAKPHKLARAGVCSIPEGRGIFPNLTVRENLRMMAYRGGVSADDIESRAYGRFERLGERRSQLAGTLSGGLDWIEGLFPVVGQTRTRQAGALSGGQQQQLAIARALVSGPDVLLLDEPSLGLAPTVVDVVLGALNEIRDRGVTVLLVEQRAQRTVALADRTYVMTNGEIRMTLTPADADDTDRIVAAYMAS